MSQHVSILNVYYRKKIVRIAMGFIQNIPRYATIGEIHSPE